MYLIRPHSSRRLMWLAVALAFVPSAILAQDPLAELKRVSHGTKSGLSVSDAYNIAAELARPVSSDASVVQALGQLLANEQLDWQAGRKAGLDEGKLLTALNRHLGLENAPEYLRLRPHELRKIRVNVWIEVPELSTGVDRKQASKGSQVIGSTLSPFEAYLASSLLIYQKRFYDDYVRTAAEENVSRSSAAQPVTPGLHAQQVNSRRLEFQKRLDAIATQSSAAVTLVKLISDVLGESRND